MNPFKDFIKESFSIPRANMPQIENVKKFCSFLEQKGVSCEKQVGLVDHYKPSQSEGFDEMKIKLICLGMRRNPEKRMKPIIVSSDGYVIDGHHRYIAATRTQQKIPYILVDTTANKLLKLAYEYTGTD
jgi:hypothetical protein